MHEGRKEDRLRGMRARMEVLLYLENSGLKLFINPVGILTSLETEDVEMIRLGLQTVFALCYWTR